MGINTNLDEIIQKAKNEYACELDGNILEDEYLKIACIRTPDGQTLQLTQTIKEFETE